MRKYRVPRKKIKRYYSSPTLYRRGPRPFVVAAILAGVIGLVCLGVMLYRPIYDAVMQFGESLRQSEPVSSSGPEPDTGPEPDSGSISEPEPEPPAPVSGLNAVLMPREAAADPALLEEFLGSMPEGANAVMFDIKNSAGEVMFHTRNAQASAWGAVSDGAVNLSGLAESLAEKNIRLIARIYAFRDPLAAAAGREECAVMYEDTDRIWIDNTAENGGKPWLNPYLPNVRQYIVELALEAVEQGAAMVVLADARFPDSSRIQANFGPEAGTVSRSEALARFFDEFGAAIKSDSVRVAVELPALDAASQANWDVRYGGSPLDLPLPELLLDVTPEQFGAGFSENGLSIIDPAGDPSGAAKAAAEYAEERLAAGSGKAPGLALAIAEGQKPGAGGRETVVIN